MTVSLLGVRVGDASVSAREGGAISGLGLSLVLPKEVIRDFTLDIVRPINVRDLCRFMMNLLSTNMLRKMLEITTTPKRKTRYII